MTKIIPQLNAFRGNRELLPGPATERCWIEIRRHIPTPLSAEADAALYSAVIECCSGYLTRQARHEIGKQLAALVRADGGKGVAPLAQFAKHLRAAADIWSAIKAVHDDRTGLYDQLDLMIWNVDGWLWEMKQMAADDPWSLFVADVARACLSAGLKPVAAGGVYDEKGGRPTWFQQFIAELDRQFLGAHVLHGDKRDLAFYAGIARALHGYRKKGNPPKRIS